MEMKYLRRVMGMTRLDRVRNVDVRNELELIDKIEQGQLRWFGHLIRTKDDMPVNKYGKQRPSREEQEADWPEHGTKA